jgi:hypothetical protein
MKGLIIDCDYLIEVARYMPLPKPRPKLDLPIIFVELSVWE